MIKINEISAPSFFWIIYSIDPASATYAVFKWATRLTQLTLMQAYAIERRLEMIQLYLGTDPNYLLMLYYLKKVQDGRKEYADLSDTEDSPWIALAVCT